MADATGLTGLFGNLELKRSAIVDAPVNNLKAQGFVAGQRELVVNPCIGGHLETSVAPRPIFCCTEQAAADTVCRAPSATYQPSR